MGYEIDFLPVGDGKCGGDAIAVRWGNLNGPRSSQFVMIIDGGTKDSGQALVDHVKKYYGTDRVDLIVSTHPDCDHTSGLTIVLEKLTVDELWIHCPWEHSKNICDLFEGGRIPEKKLAAYLRKALENAWELRDIATKKGVKIAEPFSDSGLTHSHLTILGPTKEYYENLLPHYRDTPPAAETKSLMDQFAEEAKTWISKVFESLHIETLTDPDEKATSAENNSSVIFLLEVEGMKLLFTGDAGVPALDRAIDRAEELGISLDGLRWLQVPHHGSKRNVGPTLLNRLIGSPHNGEPSISAFVSVPKEGEPKHPAKKVMNAFKRRGVSIVATKGVQIRHSHAAPPREGWTAATPLPFYDEVDE